MKKLSNDEQIELKEMLSHLHVSELESLLEQLNLSSKSFNKSELVTRLFHYAITGQELSPVEIPAASKAPRGSVLILAPHTRMFYGSYKNDLATRNFFKKLIGNHFHFIALRS